MEELLTKIKACEVCRESLPLGPNPIVTASSSSQIVLIGQAPGVRVHESSIPWNDPSGDRLRDWLQVGKDIFYDASKIALIPMGFCYPGKGKSGDLPPRPECAPLWHEALLQEMPQVKITILIGQYAQRYYLKKQVKKNLTETVKSFREYLPIYLPLPHPSPRNLIWLKKNSWFEQDVLPILREKVKSILDF